MYYKQHAVSIINTSLHACIEFRVDGAVRTWDLNRRKPAPPPLRPDTVSNRRVGGGAGLRD